MSAAPTLPHATDRRYAAGMAFRRQDATIRRGAEVAKRLGWPQDQVGLIGAFGGLLDIGAPMRRPRSMADEVRKRHAKTAPAVEQDMSARGEGPIAH
jgi:hypothetical protein